MAHECKLCMESPSSFFDWHCHGCRARWLATLPSKEWRQQAVDGWRKAGEIEMVAAVIERLKEMARV